MSDADIRVPTSAPPFDPPGWAGVGACALGSAETFSPRLLPYHLLLLVRTGQGTVAVDFDERPCRPGTLLWVRPGQALSLATPGLEASLVTFEPRLASDHDPAGPHEWQLDEADLVAAAGDMDRLATDSDRHEPSEPAAELLRRELGVLLARLALLSDDGQGTSETQTYARFHRSLENGHPVSRRVEDYASDLGCSVRTLTRACLAVTGRSAKQVVDERVSLQARRLLACTPISVAEVGRRLGFPEPTNFGRFFHREVGMSPGQFRTEFGNQEAAPADQ